MVPGRTTPRKRSAGSKGAMTFPNAATTAADQGRSSPKNDELPEDYALKRQRNNAAVNKTREKKRQQEVKTQQRVQELRNENERLERKVESMRRELELLKEVVVVCASGGRPSGVNTE